MSKTSIGLLAGGVLLLAVLAVFFIQPSWIFGDPVARKLAGYADAAERTCLSNTGSTHTSDVQVYIDQLKGGAKAASGQTELRGAPERLQGELLKQENDSIRDCMQQFVPAMLQAVGGQQTSDNFPKGLTLYVSLPKDQFRDGAGFLLGVKTPAREAEPQEFKRQKDKPVLFDNIITPDSDGAFDAWLARTHEDSVASTDDDAQDKSRICLARSKTPPKGAHNLIFLHCTVGMTCTEFDETDPGWMVPVACPKPASGSADHAMLRLPLVTTAFAAENLTSKLRRVWAVPSVKTLAQRPASASTGYTHFKITSADFKSFAADGFQVNVTVNGTPVLVDGLPSSYRTEQFKPGAPFAYEFALQNLDFDGRNAGCETIAASIQFVKGGAPAGDAFALTRDYVALRSATPVQLQSQGKAFVWDGLYVASRVGGDSEIFLESSEENRWENTPRLLRAQKSIADDKRAFDALGLQYQGKPLVAVIRPPLATPPSYGLVVGEVQQPSEQIKFTFAGAEAQAIRNYLVGLRNQRPDLARIVDKVISIQGIQGKPVPNEIPERACGLKGPDISKVPEQALKRALPTIPGARISIK